ncbi:MFS transporter [Paraburkholderia nemoris]|uniref:MFS transporter n=1 Tax=Paraburkholderia nemoris TaxID=2793076 RepID=UPI001F31A593|nr:MFS transporter [Paraburkholderia nemoris]
MPVEVVAEKHEETPLNLLARAGFSSDADWKLYNRIASRLLPFLILLYVISFVDRINIGFAKLRMAGDIGLSDAAYGFGAGIFFVAYCLCEVPSNLMLARVGARFWIARIMIVWGVVSAAMMFVHSPLSFYLMRALLGAAEAGFFPGVILYLTYWFPARQRAQAVSLFLLGIALAGVLGGPLSGWLMQTLDGRWALHSWQWLFLLEGAPAVLAGIATLRVLDDNPAKAGWLDPDECQRVLGTLAHERAARDAQGHAHRLGDALRSGDVWRLSLINFTQIGGIYGLAFWLPQIIHELGVKGLINTGFVSAIPFGISAIGMVLVGRHSDRSGERRWHVAGPALIGAFGLVLSGTFATMPTISLLGLTLAAFGLISANAVLFALPGTLLSGTAAAAGIGLISTIGNIGGYVFPFTIGWIRELTGRPSYCLFVLAAVSCVGALVMLRMPSTGRARNHVVA